jgi:hypothetical protein
MSIEQKLTDALRDEAEARDVDTARLWARTEQSIERRPSRRGRRLPVLAAAVAALVVTAGVAGLSQLDREGDADPAEQVTTDRDAVDDEFTCPEQITHDWTRPESVTDPYFVASLRGGPERQASEHGAARYEYEEQGDRAFLRFGNADGSLALVSEFHRKGGDWVRFRSDVCTGENGTAVVPTRGELELGLHEDEPHPLENMAFGERKGEARLLDDRRYYDHVGLIRHRSLYALECGRRICLSSGDGMSSSGTSVPAGVVPHDVSDLFLPRDEVGDPLSPYGLWVLWDVEGVVASVRAEVRGQEGQTTHSFYVSGWPGQLHAVLAPFDEVESLTVHRRPGADPGAPLRTTYTPEELPGYQADLRR